LSLSPFFQGLAGEETLAAMTSAGLWEVSPTQQERGAAHRMTDAHLDHPALRSMPDILIGGTAERNEPTSDPASFPEYARKRHADGDKLRNTPSAGTRTNPVGKHYPNEHTPGTEPLSEQDKTKEIQRRKRLRERERRESMRTKYHALIELLQQGRRNLMSWDLYRRQRIHATDGNARLEGNLDMPDMTENLVIPSDKDAVLSECMGQLNAFNRLVMSIREEFETLHTQLDEMRTEKADLRNDKLYLREEVQRLRDEIRRLREGALQMFLASRKGDMVADVTLEAALRSRLLDPSDEQLDLLLDAPATTAFGRTGASIAPTGLQGRSETPIVFAESRGRYASYGKHPDDNQNDGPDYSTCA
jgi:hypothetical protein